MDEGEISQRIADLEQWTIEFRHAQRHRTYGEFWAEYTARDPELIAIIQGPGAATLPASIQAQLDAMLDGMEILIAGRRYPDRRLDDLSRMGEE